MQSENRSGQDVTSQYVDLQSQLTNLQKAEQDLQAIMDEAQNNPGNDSTTKTQDVLNVYNQIVTIRGQIEQIQGQMKYIDETTSTSVNQRDPDRGRNHQTDHHWRLETAGRGTRRRAGPGQIPARVREFHHLFGAAGATHPDRRLWPDCAGRSGASLPWSSGARPGKPPKQNNGRNCNEMKKYGRAQTKSLRPVFIFLAIIPDVIIFKYGRTCSGRAATLRHPSDRAPGGSPD